RFGDARVFMDIQDSEPGQNFARSIAQTISATDYVVAVIGPRWLETQQRRTGAEDFVRHEIAAALERDVTLLPVLVGGARMPAAADLPPDIAALGYRHALEVRDDRFDEDAARLVRAVSTASGDTAGAPEAP